MGWSYPALVKQNDEESWSHSSFVGRSQSMICDARSCPRIDGQLDQPQSTRMGELDVVMCSSAQPRSSP